MTRILRPGTVVVVSADAEWRAVRPLFPDTSIERTPYGECFDAEIIVDGAPYPLLFAHGGWGKIAAAGATQYIIDRWSPSLLVNLGTCGGFAGRIEREEIVLVERTVVYDILEQMGDHAAAIAHYSVEVDLSWLGDPLPHDVRRGLLVSGDRDLVAEEIPGLVERYEAFAGDWESGAIAWVAARNGVATLILRGVTDLVGVGGGEAYDGNADLFVEGAARVMRTLIAGLPFWLSAATRHR
jgi:adenosylhomocysteine nucleosidase